MKRMVGKKPYDGYWIYSPVINSSSGRRIMVLVSRRDGSKTSLSYARYLMSVSVGRILTDKEFVDHIDENKLNDQISNLQILTQSENNRKHRKCAGIKPIRFKFRCPICREIFVRDRRQSHLGKKGFFTACSRSCSGKARALLGHGFVVNFDDNVLGIE